MRPKTRNHTKRANKKRHAKSYAKKNTTEKKTQKQITKKTLQCETNYRSKHAKKKSTITQIKTRFKLIKTTNETRK